MVLLQAEEPTIIASSFEILQSHSGASQGLAGNIGVEDEGALQALMVLCAKRCVDKVIVVYKNYEFSLIGVSFRGENKNPGNTLRRNKSYAFYADDVHLESLSKVS